MRDPRAILSISAPGGFPRNKAVVGVEFTTRLHLVPMLGMSAAILILFVRVFMEWAGTTLPFRLGNPATYLIP